ncbi:conserved hypothetical protein [Thioalkalivibrio sulfidiphilus HL-EbGr7]|uniref:Uncharacterized protein n=1 Tax=Thioalkalivibrio sulfidiphilus (strain HL-EbGR7) TaxID=396588 RepID=B8GLD3_THISH|nr:DUF6776 family protein [Thioalkalivibrio sulfidiphilus]ACL73488.1 conserved hypothetical protein [Thioalkalivibrio sulfidiphilus HL-EbGr7]
MKSLGTQGGYRVRYHHPVRRALIWGGLAVALILAGWGLFEAGQNLGGERHSDARGEIRELQRRVASLERTNRELVQRNARLERGQIIEKAAAERLRENLADMQTRLQSMDEELTFYRNIVSPENLESGLHIHSFVLEPVGASGEYVFRAVLTQIRGTANVEGTLELAVRGQRGGAKVDVPADALGEGSRPFSFRYFQNIEGRVLLPEGVRPEQIKVTLTPAGNRPRVVEQEYGWHASLRTGN